MDILLRNLNPVVIKSIDERAKKSKQSRQEFLKSMIENYTMLHDLNDRELALKTTLDKSTEVIVSMQHQLEKNNELLSLLLEEEEEE
ncbi:hypothetical protein [Thalassobacillus sp. C254]|uniref:hypothetical protein n=1 Tax=Thalassobacillus sp. C254 TaxID=1225341 RepID=UPI0006D1A068|nr:hypothetical protein [Thalassobacillus sp. C254]